MNNTSIPSHLYFGGGAIQGMSYIGLIEYIYLENMMSNITHIAGTSIGAYFGMILALQIPFDYINIEIEKIAKKVREYIGIRYNNLSNLYFKYGVLSLDFFIEPIQRYLKNKYNIDDISFSEFANKTGIMLYVNTMNINTGCNKIFSTENTPNLSVLSAIKASMSLPLLFQPVLIDGEYYIDPIISDYSVYDNIDPKYVLNIDIKNENKFKKETSFSFSGYINRIKDIILCLIFKNKQSPKNTFYISNLHYDSSMRFKHSYKDIYLDLTYDDINKMQNKAFNDFKMYMNEKKLN
jgi:predicted patatin/cPLA2 family phospholipase